MVKNRNIFITGTPGCGKTTLIRKISGVLGTISIAGFYTEEIRVKGRRKGFRICTFDGMAGVLAHESIYSKYMVSRYGVDLPALDKVIGHLQNVSRSPRIWLIDEIGKMESYSAKFREFVENIIQSPTPLMASISMSAGGWIAGIRNREDISMLILSEENRDFVLRTVLNRIEALLDNSIRF